MSWAASRPTRAGALEPMYASIGTDIPRAGKWTFEPKYDGIRVLAYATPRGAALVTRNGKAKSEQFPEIVDALQAHARRAKRSLVLDGEIVALRDGSPARFQQLQARMHVQDRAAILRHTESTPAALIAFDMLVDGDDVLLDEPWTERRRSLEKRLRTARPPLVLGESVPDGGERLLERARREGWEGLIAKRADAPYRPGLRSRDWLKLKIEHRQEFVVGGWTEPRNTRPHIGALLLGYFEGDQLIYSGHMGGGFTRAALEDMYHRLRPLEQPTSPFASAPRTNEPAHWVRPKVVVEVRFIEWTADGKLRQPIFLGVRDDKEAREVTRETRSVQGRRGVKRAAKSGATKQAAAKTRASRAGAPTKRATARRGAESIEAQLRRIEHDGGDGELQFEDGASLRVSSLGKTFFPEPGFTKGDLLRYYARVAPHLLPLMADRPLALRRFPNGVGGMSFYQQNAGDRLPDGVRVADVEDAKGQREPRFIGGDLLTLLYTVQIGSIDVHPWLSRLDSLEEPDISIIDLDPGAGVKFRQVVEAARLVKRELDAAKLVGALKTSGSRGLHIGIALPRGFTYDESAAIARAIARRVVDRAPELTTLERSIKARPKGTIYVDYQQNARGKTVACAWAVRARPAGTVSMPLSWSALRSTLDPARFTIASVPRLAAKAQAAWNAVLRKPNPAGRLRAVLD